MAGELAVGAGGLIDGGRDDGGDDALPVSALLGAVELPHDAAINTADAARAASRNMSVPPLWRRSGKLPGWPHPRRARNGRRVVKSA